MNEFGKGRPTQRDLFPVSTGGDKNAQHGRLSTILCGVLGLLIFLLDYFLPTPWPIPFLYVFVVLVSWWMPTRHGLFAATGWGSILIILGAFTPQAFQEIPTDSSNRILALIIIWSLTLFFGKIKNEELVLTETLQEKTTQLDQTHSDLQASILRRKKTEQDMANLHRTLLEQNQELETIVSVASHDLRSPLVNIQGFSKELAHSHRQLQGLLESHKLAPSVKQGVMAILDGDIPESLHYIQAGAKKMEALLHGLLRFSRLGRLSLKFEDLNMNDMITGIIMGMEYQLKEKGIALQIEDLPNCTGDATLVNQLFFNLIDNAQKYVSPNRPGMIRITGVRENGYSTFGVEDNGIGIKEEHQERIFQMFHRLNPSTGGGQGLGLTIVRRIVERHKGQLAIHSLTNRGTTFTVSLPLSPE